MIPLCLGIYSLDYTCIVTHYTFTIPIGTIDPQFALNKIEAEYKDVSCDKTDGLKLIWNNSWLHIRK